jgi:hypothetical protein
VMETGGFAYRDCEDVLAVRTEGIHHAATLLRPSREIAARGPNPTSARAACGVGSSPPNEAPSKTGYRDPGYGFPHQEAPQAHAQEEAQEDAEAHALAA